MPSWSSRLLHRSQASNAAQSTDAEPPNQSKNGSHLDVITSTSSCNVNQISQRSSGGLPHGRPYSHPQTTIFSPTKKGRGRHRNGSDPSPSHSSYSSTASPAQSAPTEAIRKSPGASELISLEEELVSGRCATCGSAVKWPKHLSAYRCTICLMTNDLRPTEDRSQPELDKVCSDRPSELSLSITERLIDDCVLRYLHKALHTEHKYSGNGSQTYEDVQTVNPPLHALEDRTTRDSLETTNGDKTPSKLSSVSYTTLCNCGEYKPHPHPPSVSSFLSIPKVSFGSSSQMDAAALLINSPPSLSSRSFKQQKTHRWQYHHANRNSACESIFWPVENYITRLFCTPEVLNNSFSSSPSSLQRSVSEGTMPASNRARPSSSIRPHQVDNYQLDAKSLLLGDAAENGAWWLGRPHAEPILPQARPTEAREPTGSRTSFKSPKIDFVELRRWYQTVLTAGLDWRTKIQEYQRSPTWDACLTSDLQARLDAEFSASGKQLRSILSKAIETLLRRPGRPLKTSSDCRFLLIILEYLLFHSSRGRNSRHGDFAEINSHKPTALPKAKIGSEQTLPRLALNTSRNHTGLIKRLLGIMAHLSPEIHQHLISWYAQYPTSDFGRLVDLVGGFMNHRLLRLRQRLHHSQIQNSTSVLVPQTEGRSVGTTAELYATLGMRAKSSSLKVTDERLIDYDDWQIKAAAKVMSLLFQANNSSVQCHTIASESPAANLMRRPPQLRHPLNVPADTRDNDCHRPAGKSKQLLPASAFYNTLLDYYDIVADFETWEHGQMRFSFCQYPMLVSIWAKIRILEYDARRQMEIKARQAFFSSILSRNVVSQYLVLKVRRDCLVEDSLRGVSEVVGAGEEEIKKSLRIVFQGEEGVDAGGLRKEWFLLLVREVFDPEHGLFVYDSESQYCYFNPNSLEKPDQFFLIGIVLGLAIYNSTTLDVALPPFTFRKLLAAAPAYTGPAQSLSRPSTVLSLGDLAEYRPALASGLQQLLEFEGDVDETFCCNFVAVIDRYGQLSQAPLCPDGENRAVTNSNRAEFVKLYIEYLLEASVARQFEPFKRGFFSVCGGNALSLFRPEEIELLVRGSDEPLNITTLEAVATYDGWKKDGNTGNTVVTAWFWELFGEATPSKQRALLSFITGSDRLPAMGATSLIIKLSCLGDDTQRFPIARTCFNMIGLYRYTTKEQLSSKLWTAVAESEGFGLK